MNNVDFMSLRYQASPCLVIEALLSEADPSGEIENAIFALNAFGLKQMARDVFNACPEYGIDIPPVITETVYYVN